MCAGRNSLPAVASQLICKYYFFQLMMAGALIHTINTGDA